MIRPCSRSASGTSEHERVVRRDQPEAHRASEDQRGDRLRERPALEREVLVDGGEAVGAHPAAVAVDPDRQRGVLRPVVDRALELRCVHAGLVRRHALPRLARPGLGAAHRGCRRRRGREQQAGADDDQRGSHGLLRPGFTDRLLPARRARRAGSRPADSTVSYRYPALAGEWGYSFVTQLTSRRHPWPATGSSRAARS